MLKDAEHEILAFYGSRPPVRAGSICCCGGPAGSGPIACGRVIRIPTRLMVNSRRSSR
jgi:hypothetical protein